ncbi:hypothetical protein GUITHDRAFT_109608 [Guillardia theta CCMP2712]|uniref:Fe2OG dioxygenase domain-containing protein n=1 Tax=Guillardia theta (strain CCMP2712) TaxID=905079 RepID=L1J7G9_GUITC|nr:hypothetical protein GUITHDRAFT_109608 [Guillardia theta CCMP2712]EKX44488.1 hypothetical protein GUITHDRAFT_109608 [Guillardia theta CCMP2712]|eukprot:XP_005831468.1 hypothetical protein GUITHDRAFT_109608 [Guillardia theta CCMP2712]
MLVAFLLFSGISLSSGEAVSAFAPGAMDLYVETTDGKYLGMKEMAEGQDSVTLVEHCCDLMSTFRVKEFPEGRHALQNVYSDRVLSMTEGNFVFVHVESNRSQSNSTAEIMWINDELLGSHTCSFRSDAGLLLGFDEQGKPRAHEVASAGLRAMFLLRDEAHYRKLDELRVSGFTVLEVLEPSEAEDARDALQGILERSTGGSDGYQIRIPDVAVHHPLFGELLVHPVILFLVRSYLGRYARCATWSSNTLLPKMDHPRLGWHVDYPYHDIEIGMWPDLPLGLQVLWLLDNFTSENGGTMFYPGSHEFFSPPNIEQFSTPEILTAPAGSVLVAHSAWWHRQTQNKSPNPRHALLGCFTRCDDCKNCQSTKWKISEARSETRPTKRKYCRGFVVPKADMETQFDKISQMSSYWANLDPRQQADLQQLMLGSHSRALRDVQA